MENNLGKIKKDKFGNSINGRSFVRDSNNCYLRSENRLVVGQPRNITIIETRDAILVADIDHIQKVKELVNDLDKRFSEGNKNKVYRPWEASKQLKKTIIGK